MKTFLKSSLNQIFFVIIFSSSLLAGHRVGNGGDHIRSTYLKMGEAVLDFLKATDEGRRILDDHALDLLSLQGSLDVEKIKVEEFIPNDNSGSLVDALGSPGIIILNSVKWMDHFEKNRDVYYLVFHEMLRSVSVNDDNYIISKKINPFPLSLRVTTRVLSEYPILGDDFLKNSVDIKSISIGGSGCGSQDLGNQIDFDFQNNILELDLQKYRVVVGGSNKSNDTKGCSIAIPFKGVKNTKIIISQLDMSAKVNLVGESDAKISAEAFISGAKGKIESKEFKNISGETKGRLLLRRNDSFTSKCGSDVILRVNSRTQLSSLDSKVSALDVERIKVYIKTLPCK